MIRLLVLSFIIVLSACTTDDILPSRSDCILKVEFEFLGEENKKNRSYNKLITKLSELNSSLYDVDIAAIRSYVEDGVLYLQFASNCEQKSDMGRLIVDIALSDLGYGDYFSYQVSDKRISPGTKTIDVRGAIWRD